MLHGKGAVWVTDLQKQSQIIPATSWRNAKPSLRGVDSFLPVVPSLYSPSSLLKSCGPESRCRFFYLLCWVVCRCCVLKVGSFRCPWHRARGLPWGPDKETVFPFGVRESEIYLSQATIPASPNSSGGVRESELPSLRLSGLCHPIGGKAGLRCKKFFALFSPFLPTHRQAG